MRLVAQAKCGYYPTPETVTRLIAERLSRPGDGLVRLLDPCVGEGTALARLGDHLQAETFGIEIDRQRGDIARQVLTRCLVTDYQDTRISRQAFSLLYLNPPYDWAARDDDIQASERYELTFLRDNLKYLCPAGLLVYLIPQRRLDKRVAQVLAHRFEDVAVFRFPEADYQAFRQVVVFGRLKPRTGADPDLAGFLAQVGLGQAIVPHLQAEAGRVYEVPLSPAKGRFVFQGRDIDPAELAEEVERHGLTDRFLELTRPLAAGRRLRPIMPLRHGHLA
ncbi:MAG: class I SAM-dependent methyltransferase [Deltaproteobacteria bacterium]|nr:class I SAM-dependent methyltransferase [Deltaproteobacteria bacterium]